MTSSNKENKQAISKAFFYTYEENASSKLLGKKPKKAKEESDSQSGSNKTNIHGIIFKKNNTEKTVKKITCNCKNSQCLKLYCECFAKLAFCDPDICSCKGCANTKENEVKLSFLVEAYLFFYFLVSFLLKEF